MKIGIDLDNVLNNLTEEWIKAYNKDYDDNLTLNDITKWELNEIVKCGDDIFKYLNGDLFKKLKPQPYSIEVTERLSKRFDLYIVTASTPKDLDVKIDWLEKYFPHIPYKNIFVCQRKYMIDIDVLIDDSLYNVMDLTRIGILYTQAWNKNDYDDLYSYKRVYNWLDIESFLSKCKGMVK